MAASSSSGPDLTAIVEAEAEARDRDFAEADQLLAQVPAALKAEEVEKAVDLCSSALTLKYALWLSVSAKILFSISQNDPSCPRIASLRPSFYGVRFDFC